MICPRGRRNQSKIAPVPAVDRQPEPELDLRLDEAGNLADGVPEELRLRSRLDMRRLVGDLREIEAPEAFAGARRGGAGWRSTEKS